MTHSENALKLFETIVSLYKNNAPGGVITDLEVLAINNAMAAGWNWEADEKYRVWCLNATGEETSIENQRRFRVFLGLSPSVVANLKYRVEPHVEPNAEEGPHGVYRIEPFCSQLKALADPISQAAYVDTDAEVEAEEKLHEERERCRKFIETALNSHSDLCDALGRVTQFMENAVTDSHADNRTYYSQLAHQTLSRASDPFGGSKL